MGRHGSSAISSAHPRVMIKTPNPAYSKNASSLGVVCKLKDLQLLLQRRREFKKQL